MGISACCAGHCHSAGFPEPGAEPRLCRVMVLLDAARTAVAPQPPVSPDTAPLAAGHTRGHAPSPGAALARLWFPRPSRVCLHGARTPQGSGFPPQQAGANRDRLGQPRCPRQGVAEQTSSRSTPLTCWQCLMQEERHGVWPSRSCPTPHRLPRPAPSHRPDTFQGAARPDSSIRPAPPDPHPSSRARSTSRQHHPSPGPLTEVTLR